jgi:hypothetical protein
VCATCQFGKAHKQSHKANTRHISLDHSAPGEVVSSDGMEAECPGKIMTTHGLPSSRHYNMSLFGVTIYLNLST